MLHGLESACEQLVSVTAVQAAGLVFFAGDLGFGLSLAAAAAVVQAGLGLRIAALRAARRIQCLEVIVEAEPPPPLPCVERACRRLLDGCTAELLARSIDETVAAATHPPAVSTSRPLTDSRTIRATAPELREVASLLRADPAVRGVALVEWLLTAPKTPLYGREVGPLREELRRARYLLTPRSG